MLNKEGRRELAYVVIVDNITPIEGYDRVELAEYEDKNKYMEDDGK